MKCIPFLIVALLLSTGCSDQDQNSNVHVFKTAKQLVADRRTKQVELQRDLAMSILKSSRSDITITPKNAPPPTTAPVANTGNAPANAAPAATQPAQVNSQILVQADGQSMLIDILQVSPQIEAHPEQERNILKQFLESKLQQFDTQRATAIGFENAKTQLIYELASVQSVAESEKQVSPNKLIEHQVVGEMHKVVMIRKGDVKIPVTDAIAKAWHVGDAEIESAAMANLSKRMSQIAPDALFETLPYGSAGRTGTLKSNVDPAIILLPEFLKAVQSQWKTEDNLIIQAIAPAAMTFIEEHNQVLLDRLYPQWKGQLVNTKNPLCGEMILRDDQKLSYAGFKPTSKPSTAPTTKPRTIFVH